MAHVSDIFVAVDRRELMKPVDQAVAVANRGLEGCKHGRPGSNRQILLVDSETLNEFGLVPGVIRENITTVGLDTANLRSGERLLVGAAVLEVTAPCEPCSRMDEIRMGLQKALRNRRGILCRVVEGGRISRGDAIQITQAAAVIPLSGGAR